jgi:Carboxypeptidase regulatory-like domain
VTIDPLPFNLVVVLRETLEGVYAGASGALFRERMSTLLTVNERHFRPGTSLTIPKAAPQTGHPAKLFQDDSTMMRSLFTLVGAILVSTGALAMTPQGSLTGRVVDPDGGLVARLATDVTLTHTGSGAKVTGRLGDDGTYVVREIPPGTYDIDMLVPARLYNRYQRGAVPIEAGKETRLDLLVPWGMNLGTVGDDPLIQSADMRAKTTNIDGPIQRLADGKPDLSGVWLNIGDAVTRPPLPLQPWARAIADELAKIKQDNPGAYCLPQVAVPTLMHYPQRFVQGPDRIIQIMEDMDPSYRQIFMDGSPHPDPDLWNPSWYGHSIGHWEGDTLVVDTVGFNEITPGFGVHSESLHVIERYTRISRGRMQVEMFAEDPEAWTAPQLHKWVMGLADGAEVVEFLCAEGYESQAMQRAPWKGRP